MQNIKRPTTTSTLIVLSVTCLALLAAGGAHAGDAYLGIAVSGLSPSMARALKLEEDAGVLVDRVVIGSPAEQAGLESGDVILALEDRTIAGNRDLTRRLGEHGPGDTVELSILREGKQRKLKVVLGERPQRKVDGRGFVFEGKDLWNWFDGGDQEYRFDVQKHLTKLTAGYLGVVLDDDRPAEDRNAGALIASVTPESPAQRAGLQAGDLIVGLADTDIADEAALQERLQETRPGETVVVRFVRDGESREVEAELAGMAERLGLAELIENLKSRDHESVAIHLPRHALPGEIERLAEERESLDELKQELAELKAQLQKLREELREQR